MGRGLVGEEAIGGAGGGWLGLNMLVRFWPAAPLYLHVKETLEDKQIYQNNVTETSLPQILTINSCNTGATGHTEDIK